MPQPLATFLLEQTLGHVTHGQNLRRLLADHPLLQTTFLDIPFELSGTARMIPGFGNWTVRSGVRARRAIRAEWRSTGIDVMFIHTHVPASMAGQWMERIPTVVSMDATPEQYDQLGMFYGHTRSSPRVEQWKKVAAIRCFHHARHIVAWSRWTADSLVRDYDVNGDRITVIPPGVHVERWDRPRPRSSPPTKILFVGGDLPRKGASLLIEAASRLRADRDVPEFQVHLVTPCNVDAGPGVTIHNNLQPNSPELIELYQASDIFCLPTLGDCLPMVLSEAGVAGLALVTSDVGAISEFVKHEETGLLVPPGDLDALIVALRRVLTDPALRAQLGNAAEMLVRAEYDARTNADKIAHLLFEVANGYA